MTLLKEAYHWRYTLGFQTPMPDPGSLSAYKATALATQPTSSWKVLLTYQPHNNELLEEKCHLSPHILWELCSSPSRPLVPSVPCLYTLFPMSGPWLDLESHYFSPALRQCSPMQTAPCLSLLPLVTVLLCISLHPRISTCGPQSSCISISRELVRSGNS